MFRSKDIRRIVPKTPTERLLLGMLMEVHMQHPQPELCAACTILGRNEPIKHVGICGVG